MDDKIVDIYNLDSLKSDCNYFTMRITLENSKIHSFEIDGESHNKNKINIHQSQKMLFINLYDIIEEYNYDCTLIGIKFKIHNINQEISYVSSMKSDKSIYDGQIIIDDIYDKFQIQFYKSSENEKITGSIQINIYELAESRKSQHENIRNYLQYYYDVLDVNEFCYLKIPTIYFKILKNYVKLDIPLKCNKVVKKYEIPFIQKNIEGTVQLECYSNCSIYFYYVITRIVYNGSIIDTTQNYKCDCSEYTTLDYIRTDNKFTNKIKMCWCFLDKLYKILKELKLYTIYIKKEDLIKRLNFENDVDSISRYYKV